MINPKIRAKDRIFSELPPELKELMRKHILSEEEHMRILQDIMENSYRGKTPVENPSFIIVCGQTGSGKSNLTASLYNQNSNVVVIDSDKYKGYRADSQDILKEHLAEYAFLTAPDAYLHRDEMIVDAISKRYNILMECATSQKEGLFIDIQRLIELGYRPEIHALGVSSLNSLLSAHERYEALMQLNDRAAKLTSVERHDDSFISLNSAIKNAQNIPGVAISVYERGTQYPFFPTKVYSSDSDERRFSCALEALLYTQGRDEQQVMQTFESRFSVVRNQMINREAPDKQLVQLAIVKQRYEETMQEKKKIEQGE